MKNRTRENCTSGSVRDEAGQPPHLLGRRQFLHLAVDGAAIRRSPRRVVRRFLNPTTRATDLVNRSCDYMTDPAVKVHGVMVN